MNQITVELSDIEVMMLRQFIKLARPIVFVNFCQVPDTKKAVEALERELDSVIADMPGVSIEN